MYTQIAEVRIRMRARFNPKTAEERAARDAARARYRSAPNALYEDLCTLYISDACRAITYCSGDDDGEAVVDPNAPVFGPQQNEPLMHALARRHEHGRIAPVMGCVREMLGGDPSQPHGERGETPLFLAMRGALDERLAGGVELHPTTVIALARDVGGDINAPQTARPLAEHFVDAGDVYGVGQLRNAGMGPALRQMRPLLHRAITVGRSPRLVQFLLDHCDHDPTQRCRRSDGQGWITALEAARACPETTGVLLEAGADTRPRDLAVAMALHARLGAASPLHALDAALLRALVLPHATRREDVEPARAWRVRAFREVEGIADTPAGEATLQYTRYAARFAPAQLRRDHFVERMLALMCARRSPPRQRPPERESVVDDDEEALEADGYYTEEEEAYVRDMDDADRDAIERSIDRAGVTFDAPYSAALEAEARQAIMILLAPA